MDERSSPEMIPYWPLKKEPLSALFLYVASSFHNGYNQTAVQMDLFSREQYVSIPYGCNQTPASPDPGSTANEFQFHNGYNETNSNQNQQQQQNKFQFHNGYNETLE
jgi:hypothetical protein